MIPAVQVITSISLPLIAVFVLSVIGFYSFPEASLQLIDKVMCFLETHHQKQLEVKMLDRKIKLAELQVKLQEKK